MGRHGCGIWRRPGGRKRVGRENGSLWEALLITSMVVAYVLVESERRRWIIR